MASVDNNKKVDQLFCGPYFGLDVGSSPGYGAWVAGVFFIHFNLA